MCPRIMFSILSYSTRPCFAQTGYNPISYCIALFLSVLILVTWIVNKTNNGAAYLPITWVLTTSINVTALLNGAQLKVELNYTTGSSSTWQTSAQSTFDFYSLFMGKSY